MARRLSSDLLLALRINSEAIKQNLIVFHGKTPEQAQAMVKPLEQDTSDIVLHSEPYLAAFELARGDEPLPPERYQADRAKAVEILARVRILADMNRQKFKTTTIVEKFLKTRGSKVLAIQNFKLSSSKKQGSKKLTAHPGFSHFKKQWGKKAAKQQKGS